MSPPLPVPLTEEQLDREFMAQVEPEWEKLLTCIQCGTCSASCPTADLMDYSPASCGNWSAWGCGTW